MSVKESSDLSFILSIAFVSEFTFGTRPALRETLFISVRSVIARQRERARHSTGTVVADRTDSSEAELLAVKAVVGRVVRRVGSVRRRSVVAVHTPVSGRTITCRKIEFQSDIRHPLGHQVLV